MQMEKILNPLAYHQLQPPPLIINHAHCSV
jgi:hypothetical protein